MLAFPLHCTKKQISTVQKGDIFSKVNKWIFCSFGLLICFSSGYFMFYNQKTEDDLKKARILEEYLLSEKLNAERQVQKLNEINASLYIENKALKKQFESLEMKTKSNSSLVTQRLKPKKEDPNLQEARLTKSSKKNEDQPGGTENRMTISSQ